MLGVEQCGGGKWADIKKLGYDVIAARSAVDLKDKWRNLMRVAMLPHTATRCARQPARCLFPTQAQPGPPPPQESLLQGLNLCCTFCLSLSRDHRCMGWSLLLLVGIEPAARCWAGRPESTSGLAEYALVSTGLEPAARGCSGPAVT